MNFINIQADPILMIGGKYSNGAHNDGTNHFDTTLTENEISKSFNAIEIDWNGAKLENSPEDLYGGGTKHISTTGELLKERIQHNSPMFARVA